MINHEDPQEFLGIKYKEPTRRPLESPRVPGDATIKDVVQGIPAVVRDHTPSTLDDKLRYAIMCLLGQEIDMTVLQVYWLNRAFHEKSANVFTFAEHVTTVASMPRAAEAITDECIGNLSINRWNLTDAQRQAIINEMTQVGRSVANHNHHINILAGIANIGYEKIKGPDEDGVQYFLDLDKVTLYQLVKYAGFEPVTAAKFFMITRPCEHVVLTPSMLRWANRVPAVCGAGLNLNRTPEPYPSLPPLCPHEYAKYEFYVRRQQRLFFPGRTSTECHLLIHESELAYETK